MVSKGQIQREIGKVFIYLPNSIKLENELGWEIKKIPRWNHKIKNHSIWISIHEEIKEQNKESKLDRKEREDDLIS